MRVQRIIPENIRTDLDAPDGGSHVYVGEQRVAVFYGPGQRIGANSLARVIRASINSVCDVYEETD
jgi:hypothetical protein